MFLLTFGMAAHAMNAPQTKDAEVRSSNPNLQAGLRTTLFVREDDLRNSLFEFDLSGFSAPIFSATLTLPVRRVFTPGSFEVRRLLEP
jgi:hypothetical protein